MLFAINNESFDLTCQRFEIECRLIGTEEWVGIAESSTMQSAINEVNDLVELDKMDPLCKYEYRIYSRADDTYHLYIPPVKLKVIDGGKNDCG